MKLLVGLGNPGDKYKKNRHNIGWWFIDAVAEEFGFSNWQDKFQGKVSKGVVDGISVTLLKPQTFMNCSGRSIRAAMDFYKIQPDDVWVIHDELDLEPLRVRIKQGGGEGGHNGLKSTTQCLGTKDYWRIRIGIGHPGDKNAVTPYVLSDFSKVDQPAFAELCQTLAKRMPDVLNGKANDVLSQLAQE